jgi:hypothetical protein
MAAWLQASFLQELLRVRHAQAAGDELRQEGVAQGGQGAGLFEIFNPLVKNLWD